MLGVTIPQLRDLAKVIIKDNKAKDYIYSYLNNQYPIYYEEVMILGILIARVDIKIEERLNLYRKFIPLIDNWAVCDVFCGESKWAQREPILAWSFINEFNNSPYSSTVRFMIIMMLSHFIIDDYIDKIFNIIDGLEYKEDYYIDMGVAWLIATTYAKFPNNTFEFIKGTKIHNSVLKKAAQKIRDSRRVSDDDKMKVTNLVNSNK